ncbi:MAG: DUF2470 domain-containing protein [Bacteroidota bacterium]
MPKTFNIKFMRYAVDHVNDDHSDAMLTILKGHTEAQWIDKAVLLSYDSKQMQVSGEDATGRNELFEIPFPESLSNAQEFRPVLIAMLRRFSDGKSKH